MTAPTIKQLPVRVPGATLPPRLIHGTCLVCLNNMTLCGIDATNLPPLALKSKAPTCVVCADLWDAHGWGKCLEPKP